MSDLPRAEHWFSPDPPAEHRGEEEPERWTLVDGENGTILATGPEIGEGCLVYVVPASLATQATTLRDEARQGQLANQQWGQAQMARAERAEQERDQAVEHLREATKLLDSPHSTQQFAADIARDHARLSRQRDELREALERANNTLDRVAEWCETSPLRDVLANIAREARTALPDPDQKGER